MEGDAGAGPLKPAGPAAGADEAGTEVTVAEGAADMPGEALTDATTDAAGAEPTVAVPAAANAHGGRSRLGARWVIGCCAVLLLMTAGLGAGGYLSLRYHTESQLIERDNAAAVAAAKECVLATQAPDAADVAAAERKIFDCSTGDFRTQYTLYSGVYVQAFRAANVKVQVSELRAAVERDNADGSVDVLVALRIKADNIEAQGREFGYRLRAQMAREDGQYRIARLDQVAR